VKRNKLSLDFRKLVTNTIRTLSVDMIQQSNSGHPGLPLGMADIAFVLWDEYLKHYPKDPMWSNRDRFILSAGHGSALLYSMLFLSGYDISIDDLKSFRQWESKTPGHPEYGLTPGVETTTGPLGQGFATGVGMALAAKMTAAKYNKEGFEIFGTHNIYSIVSDGDLMEGLSAEAASLAGHLKLGNLIYLYDNNKITIEGKTRLTFTEDIKQRFESCGWRTITINGHSAIGITTAINKAIKEFDRPTLIISRTHIGFGSPNQQGTAKIHGTPLGDYELRETKRSLGWPESAKFFIPPEVKEYFRKKIETQHREYKDWQEQYNLWKTKYPKLAEEREESLKKKLPEKFEQKFLDVFMNQQDDATRVSSGKLMQKIASLIPGFCGGAADLGPSTKTVLKEYDSVNTAKYDGRNFHFGIREHAMGAILNGISLYGGYIPFGSTFFTFSDYMKPSMRLAAIMGLQVIYLFTHDSIYVGEDGPTHQPIEQLSMLRSMPNLTIIRPANNQEVVFAWKTALEKKDGPSALLLSRQKVCIPETNQKIKQEDINRGGYIVWESEEKPNVILVATGSEVEMAFKCKKVLQSYDYQVRIVSMPCKEVFLQQDMDYRNSVLLSPGNISIVAVIEASAPSNWQDITDTPLKVFGINTFGKSAPANVLAEKFFTPHKVAHEIDRYFGRVEDWYKQIENDG